MQRQPIESSSLESVGYDPAGQVLEIKFRNGRVYHYLGVPPSVYDELLRASSRGAYFNAHIRDQYPTTRIS